MNFHLLLATTYTLAFTTLVVGSLSGASGLIVLSMGLSILSVGLVAIIERA
jgi:hypothetical protein